MLTSNVRWLALSLLVVACGGAELEIHEDAYVDHDIGELTAGLTISGAGGCSTAIAVGLTLQLIDEMNCIAPNTMVNFTNSRVQLYASSQPFLAPGAAAALNNAALQSGSVITVSSAYRSVAQQALLYRWGNAGQCGIQAVAVPGSSNHQSGRAIDVPNYASWINPLSGNGWRWFGNGDKVHFDFLGAKDLGAVSVLAFQKLWNKNNASKLSEDGSWGPATANAMANSPVTGFPVFGCNTTGKLTGAIYQKGNTADRVAGANVTINGVTKATGADGLYEFALAPGTYTVTVGKSGYSSASTSKAVVKGGTTWGSMEINAAAAATPTGTLTGKVYVLNPANAADLTKPIAGAVVTVSGQTQTTGADGMYKFTLPAGAHTATAGGAGYASASVARQVAVNATTWASVGLAAGSTTDTAAPNVAVTFPKNGDKLTLAQISFEGTVIDAGGSAVSATLSVNGDAPLALPVTAGVFKHDLKLVPGANTLVLNASDARGNKTSVTTAVQFVAGVVGVVHRAEDAASRIGNATVVVRRLDTGEGLATVQSGAEGTFLAPLSEVPLEVVLTVTAAGFVDYSETLTVTDEAQLSVDVALTADDAQLTPGVHFIDPTDQSTVGESSVVIAGRVTGMEASSVTVNAVLAQLAADGRFTVTVPLEVGANRLEAIAIGADGALMTGFVTVVRVTDGSAPIPLTSEHDALTAKSSCASLPGIQLLAAIAVLGLASRRRRGQ